ncbi:ZIP family metal transporter [Pontibacillus yanchengensis]|uniref:ZIP family metal transporter n=2 Tax=Pontibacillus yanchengensis TaxID=462910 RepID=A0ACC7VKJ0_9BACI|nr:ZIP family metal transporter [Pontibacillus yanchengensis]MYL34996.1 ZIP family metal transporter [Pontibacillus yanchengensis]MYL55292.1 ZIP family metal transporter [Pontibacillus yanchengensis]
MESVHVWGILITSSCTTLGALPVLMIRNLSHKGKDSLLAFTAGIMVAASTYGLIPSALKLSNLYVLVIGILIGTLVLLLLEIVVPHHDLDNTTHQVGSASILLFLVAMSLHNIPEGLSVGMSYASEYKDLGPIVSFAIGLQNVPEGFLVALFLMLQQVRRWKTLLYASLTGLIEFIASLAGVYFGGSFGGVVPYGLAFSAGAMLFIVYKELIPESHGDGNERASTLSFMIGFIVMIVLTSVLR